MKNRHPNAGAKPRPKSKSESLERMIRYAELLSEDVLFVRVDLYEESGHVGFGELTFTQFGGTHRVDPDEYDDAFGKCFPGKNGLKRDGVLLMEQGGKGMSDRVKKILIVSSYCFGTALANGICARALRDSLQDSGYDVYLLGRSEEASPMLSDHEFIVSLVPPKQAISHKMTQWSRYIKRLVWADRDKAMVQAYLSRIAELDAVHHFDAMVAMFFPMEIVCAITEYKRHRKDVFYGIYELDSKTDGIHGKKEGLIGMLQHRAIVRWVKQQYRKADLICIMESHRSDTERLYGTQFGKKLCFVDLPLLADQTTAPPSGEDGVEFAYTGELNLYYRSPEKLLRILENTSEQQNWRIHFYSKGDCEELVHRYAETDSRVTCHGYVGQEELKRQYERTSFFMNIGNICSHSVPSKLIQYISTGKPILHLCLQKDDVCADYLKQYPLSLIVEVEESAESAAKRVTDFVQRCAGQSVPFETIRELYPKNTPQYSAHAISSRIEQKNRAH